MKEPTVVIKGTSRSRNLLRDAAAVNNEKQYVVLERAIEAEYKRLNPKSSKS